MSTLALNPDVAGVSPYVLGVRQAFQEDTSKSVTHFPPGDLDIELRTSMDSVWAFVRRKRHGGLALRAADLASEFICTELKATAGEAAKLKIRSALGEHLITFRIGKDGFAR